MCIRDRRDITFLMYDNANETGAFDITRDVVHGLAKLGAFQKRWLLLPINVGFNHWILLSILHPVAPKVTGERIHGLFSLRLSWSNNARNRSHDYEEKRNNEPIDLRKRKIRLIGRS